MVFTVADRQDYLLARERLPQNDAAVFVETHLAAQSHFVRNERLDRIVTIEEDQRQAQISQDLWKQAESEKAQIFELIEKVQEKMQKKYGRSNQAPTLDARSATWSQVLGQVATTAQQWSQSRKASNVSVFIDKIGRNSEAFQTWLQVLPSGDYGASLAISAASHHYKVEEAIFESLAEIPEILDNAKRYVKIYAATRYSNLEHKTFDLYLSILQALKHIVKFFADSSAKRFYEPVLKQFSYQQDLRESLDNIRKQMERVKEEAIQCSHERLGDVEGSLLTYGNLIRQVKDESSQSATVLQAMYRMLQSALAESRNASDAGAPGLGIESSSKLGKNQLEGPPNYQRARRLLRLLRPDLASWDAGSDSGDTDDPAEEFLAETEEDVAACLGRAGTMSPQTRSKAVALMGRDEFKAFMDIGETTGSDYLLVNGHHRDGEHGLSPLTFLGAKLYQIAASMGKERPYILGYFCDEHRPFSVRGLETCKPVGMLLSLLGQLAAQMLKRGVPIDLRHLDDDRWKRIRKRKLGTLGDVFDSLVCQLSPDSKLYCIIDEFTLYEQPGMDEDLGRILYRLVKISTRCKTMRNKAMERVEFKLLVLTSRQARTTGTIFADHTIDLPEVVEARDSAQTVLEKMGEAQ